MPFLVVIDLEAMAFASIVIAIALVLMTALWTRSRALPAAKAVDPPEDPDDASAQFCQTSPRPDPQCFRLNEILWSLHSGRKIHKIKGCSKVSDKEQKPLYLMSCCGDLFGDLRVFNMEIHAKDCIHIPENLLDLRQLCRVCRSR